MKTPLEASCTAVEDEITQGEATTVGAGVGGVFGHTKSWLRHTADKVNVFGRRAWTIGVTQTLWASNEEESIRGWQNCYKYAGNEKKCKCNDPTFVRLRYTIAWRTSFLTTRHLNMLTTLPFWWKLNGAIKTPRMFHSRKLSRCIMPCAPVTPRRTTSSACLDGWAPWIERWPSSNGL